MDQAIEPAKVVHGRLHDPRDGGRVGQVRRMGGDGLRMRRSGDEGLEPVTGHVHR